MDRPYAIEMLHITKRFPGIIANDDITLQLKKGEIHALLGENGAGKSTLMNVLFGLYQPTEGSIYIHGKKVRIDSPAQAVKQGIGMVHQHFMLVEAMTVLENIILGDRNTKGIFIDKDARRREIQKLADQYGLEVELDKPITEIAVGAQQRVEILKALYRGAELLVLDEPTAGLDPAGRENLMANIRDYHRNKGKTIILVSHSMDEIARNVDRILVLKNAHVLMQGTPAEVFARGEELLSAGLDVPQITRIAMELKRRGVDIDPAVYTVEALERQLFALRKGGAGC